MSFPLIAYNFPGFLPPTTFFLSVWHRGLGVGLLPCRLVCTNFMHVTSMPEKIELGKWEKKKKKGADPVHQALQTTSHNQFCSTNSTSHPSFPSPNKHFITSLTPIHFWTLLLWALIFFSPLYRWVIAALHLIIHEMQKLKTKLNCLLQCHWWCSSVGTGF